MQEQFLISRKRKGTLKTVLSNADTRLKIGFYNSENLTRKNFYLKKSLEKNCKFHYVLDSSTTVKRRFCSDDVSRFVAVRRRDETRGVGKTQEEDGCYIVTECGRSQSGAVESRSYHF